MPCKGKVIYSVSLWVMLILSVELNDIWSYYFRSPVVVITSDHVGSFNSASDVIDAAAKLIRD